jgi:hypothetical protein
MQARDAAINKPSCVVYAVHCDGVRTGHACHSSVPPPYSIVLPKRSTHAAETLRQYQDRPEKETLGATSTQYYTPSIAADEEQLRYNIVFNM